MKSRSERRVGGGLAAALVFAIFCCSGCKVNEGDIEYWKGTVKGPGKIVAVLLADKYSLELRTRAALALIEMERPDRDGTAELQRAMERLPPESRGEVIAALVPGLEAAMNKGNPASETPTPVQIRAKDAAFLLIPLAPPPSKERLMNDVVSWYVADFNGRSLAGNFSAEQVVRALGSSAATALVAGIKAKLPQQALVKLAQLIGQLAEPAARKVAAERLVAVEQEMDSAPFLAWIEQTIREQSAKAKKAADPAAVTRTALKTREVFITEGALPAMKWLAEEPVVKQRLLSIAGTTVATDPGGVRRTRALQALEGKVGREDLRGILALALDPKNPSSVRDYAFDRVGDIRSPEALPQLWPLVSNARDARLRWRAGELVLAIGGPQIIGEFMQRLPGGDTAYPPEELEGYGARMGQMAPLPAAQVKPLLGASEWYKRVIAIQFFARKGGTEDIKALSAMKGDDGKVVGPRWGKTKTVGEVAVEAAEAGSERLAAAVLSGPGI